jgi:hypothetical protein
MLKVGLGRLGLAVALSAAVVSAVAVSAASAAGTTRQISAFGVSTITGGKFGSDTLGSPEIRKSGAEAGLPAYAGSIVDRSRSRGNGQGGSHQGNNGGNGNNEGQGNNGLLTSFDGLNLRDQRLANGGNQFTVEPPDQGLCAGNGYVLETVNDVLRVYRQNGTPATGVTDLNSFYGYQPAINRTTGEYGPFVTDPSCLYDAQTQRWFHVVLTLDTDPVTGDFLGSNHLDLAVSRTADPTGAWTLYRVPVQDDGTEGTPNHNCAGGPCIGDYPHIGADANGFYITTNEYAFFADPYHGAQIYAFSKTGLAAGTDSRVTQIDTAGAVLGNPGFTVWPAQSPNASSFEAALGGTEYLLSSDAAPEANGTGISSNLIVWSLTNTSSLNSPAPLLGMTNTVLTVQPYAIPPAADQKQGSVPLADCLNDTTTPMPASPGVTGCSTLVLGEPDPYHEVQGPLDSSDTRMQQVGYANGKLWGALGTALTLRGQNKAAIEYFAVKPKPTAVGSTIAGNGYLGLAKNNLTYPALALTADGRGVMAFTISGQKYFPSAGYATISGNSVGDLQIAAVGAGPQDGFSEYQIFSPYPTGEPRPRWGDYGAAATDGNTVWIASEYIAQSCKFKQYIQVPFGSCGGTRVALGNWATRISAVQP